MKFIRYDLYNYLRNLWVFHRALWNYRRWDYSGMLNFMELAARDMSECHEKHGHLVRSKKTAKELKIFAEYIKRIREDDYGLRHINIEWLTDKKPSIKINPIKYEGPLYGTKLYTQVEKSCSVNDMEQAARLFQRKLKTWWD